jgi:hypothetical protein
MITKISSHKFTAIFIALILIPATIISVAYAINNNLEPQAGDSITFDVTKHTDDGLYYSPDNLTISTASNVVTFSIKYPETANLDLANSFAQAGISTAGLTASSPQGNTCIATSPWCISNVPGEFAVAATQAGGKSITKAQAEAFLRALKLRDIDRGVKESLTITYDTTQMAFYQDEKGNKHFYKKIPCSNANNACSWFKAYNLAGQQVYNGLRGYLATFTSTEEFEAMQTVTGSVSGDGFSSYYSWSAATIYHTSPTYNPANKIMQPQLSSVPDRATDASLASGYSVPSHPGNQTDYAKLWYWAGPADNNVQVSPNYNNSTLEGTIPWGAPSSTYEPSSGSTGLTDSAVAPFGRYPGVKSLNDDGAFQTLITSYVVEFSTGWGDGFCSAIAGVPNKDGGGNAATASAECNHYDSGTTEHVAEIPISDKKIYFNVNLQDGSPLTYTLLNTAVTRSVSEIKNIAITFPAGLTRGWVDGTYSDSNLPTGWNGVFRANDIIFQISGGATPQAVETLLNKIKWTSASPINGQIKIEIQEDLITFYCEGSSSVDCSGGTRHYYEQVPNKASTQVNWFNAYNLAQTHTFLGLRGHLAAMNTVDEHNMISTLFAPKVDTNDQWVPYGAWTAGVVIKRNGEQIHTVGNISTNTGDYTNGDARETSNQWYYSGPTNGTGKILTSSWHSGEPNGGSSYFGGATFGRFVDGKFNDDGLTQKYGYIIEFEEGWGDSSCSASGSAINKSSGSATTVASEVCNKLTPDDTTYHYEYLPSLTVLHHYITTSSATPSASKVDPELEAVGFNRLPQSYFTEGYYNTGSVLANINSQSSSMNGQLNLPGYYVCGTQSGGVSTAQATAETFYYCHVNLSKELGFRVQAAEPVGGKFTVGFGDISINPDWGIVSQILITLDGDATTLTTSVVPAGWNASRASNTISLTPTGAIAPKGSVTPDVVEGALAAFRLSGTTANAVTGRVSLQITAY